MTTSKGKEMSSIVHVRVMPQEGARHAADDFDLSTEGAYQQLAAPLRRAILNTRQCLLEIGRAHV